MQFPKQTFWTIVTIALMIVALEYVPALQNYRLLNREVLDQLSEFHPTRAFPPEPIPTVEMKLPTQKPVKKAVEPLSDPANSLAAFYEAIERVERGEPGAKVRIAHYGDSPTTADLITADVRSLLQKRFGDGGHGFYLLAKPWAWYGHRGVDSDSSGWDIEASNLVHDKDGFYGYGGVSFRGGPGSRTRFRPKDAGTTSVEVAYRAIPGGGNLVLDACGESMGDKPTAGENEDGFALFTVPETCRDFTLRIESGPVRLYGIQFLNPASGVVYDSLGLNGAYISVLSKFLNEDHWTLQLQHYSPDVVVINYGTNESVNAAYVDKVFERELREAIRRIRTALPGKGILVMSPMDRGERNTAGVIETVPALEHLVEIESRVAKEEGVAFFNTFEAMGGNGTMAKWYSAEPRLVGADFIHPMPGGAKIIGNLLYKAMLDGYNHVKQCKNGNASGSARVLMGECPAQSVPLPH